MLSISPLYKQENAHHSPVLARLLLSDLEIDSVPKHV
jgi:hypothetical protein